MINPQSRDYTSTQKGLLSDYIDYFVNLVLSLDLNYHCNRDEKQRKCAAKDGYKTGGFKNIFIISIIFCLI